MEETYKNGCDKIEKKKEIRMYLELVVGGKGGKKNLRKKKTINLIKLSISEKFIEFHRL